eukprot:Gb_19509 [translate_table: standard]
MIALSTRGISRLVRYSSVNQHCNQVQVEVEGDANDDGSGVGVSSFSFLCTGWSTPVPKLLQVCMSCFSMKTCGAIVTSHQMQESSTTSEQREHAGRDLSRPALKLVGLDPSCLHVQ